MKAGAQAAVGAFVLGGAVLVAGTVVLFGKFNIFNPPALAAVVFQDSISGLTVGSPVTFRGVQVGSVDSVGLKLDATTRVAYIPVIVHLNAGSLRVTEADGGETVDLTRLLKDGLRAELAIQSFVTGQSEIDLDLVPGSPAVLHPGVTSLIEIPTQQSAIQKVKQQLSQLPLQDLVANTNATLKSLRVLSEQLSRDLPPLVDSLAATSAKSGQAIDVAATAIKDLQGRLGTALTSIDRLAVTGDRQLSDRGAELHTLLVSANKTTVQAQATLNDVRDMTSDRGAGRRNIDASLRDIAAAAAALRGFASDVERNPQLLLTGRKP